MLTALDETLHHQCSETFDHVLTSDHRFYDRQLMTGFAPDGAAAFLSGITVFKNMNVIEGYVLAQSHSRQQINVRFTQQLRPLTDNRHAQIGPLRLEVISPFEELRLTLEQGDYPIAMDITYRGVIPAGLEGHHSGRLDGRAHTDYRRYHQVGQARGWIEIEGERFEAPDWFGWRDHSWGVRPVVGGFEPFTGTRTPGGVASAAQTGGKGLFLIYLGFANGRQGGDIQIKENGDGERYFLEGEVYNIGGEPVRVVDARHNITFQPGTRLFETASLELDLENGDTWRLRAKPVGRPWAFCGGGTDGGFFDGLGQGVYRSRELALEVDTYDLSHPENIIMPNGEIRVPKHREQLTRCEINGVMGAAYVPMFVIGPQPRFGLPDR
jgi:hypothetical protein